MASPSDQERIQRGLCLREGVFYRPILFSCLISHSQSRSGKAGLCSPNKQAGHVSGLPQGSLFLAHATCPTLGLQGTSAQGGPSRTWAEEGFFLTCASRFYLGRGREGSKPTIRWLSKHPPGSDTLCSCLAVVGPSKSRGNARLESSRVSGGERARNVRGATLMILAASFLFTKCLAYCLSLPCPPQAEFPHFFSSGGGQS